MPFKTQVLIFIFAILVPFISQHWDTLMLESVFQAKLKRSDIKDQLLLRMRFKMFYSQKLTDISLFHTEVLRFSSEMADRTLLSSFLYNRWLSSNCQGSCCSVSLLSFFSSVFFCPLPFLGLKETERQDKVGTADTVKSAKNTGVVALVPEMLYSIEQL